MLSAEKQAQVLTALRAEPRLSLRRIEETVGANRKDIKKVAQAAGIEILSHAEASRANLKRLRADPAFVEKAAQASSENMTRLNSNPEFRAAARQRLNRLNNNPEFKAAARQRLKLLKEDPAFNSKQKAGWWQGKAKSAKMASQRMTERNSDPQVRAASSERLKRLNGDAAFKAKQAAGRQRWKDGTRQRLFNNWLRKRVKTKNL